MLKRVGDNFRRGLGQIKWFSSVFAERLKIEIAIIKLLYQSDELERRKQALFSAIGQRVFELKGHTDKNMLKDKAVMEAIEEIEKIEKNSADLKQKISELQSVGV